MNDKVAPAKATVADRLAEERRRTRPDIARAYDNLVERLLQAGAGGKAPKEGDVMPAFLLPDERGNLTDSKALLAKGPLVVSLNRGHWCSFCRIELEGLQERHAEIAARGAAVVAITPDRQDYARRLKARCNLTFPVLSDMDNAFAMSLGLVVWIGDEIRTLYEKPDVGLDLSKFHGNDGWLIPIPATYVIGRNGVIKASFVHADFRKRMPQEAILAAI